MSSPNESFSPEPLDSAVIPGSDYSNELNWLVENEAIKKLWSEKISRLIGIDTFAITEALEILEEYSQVTGWIEDFCNLIQWLDNESFINLCKEVAFDLDMKTYFENNGFPSSSLELSLFSKEFGLDLQLNETTQTNNSLEFKNMEETNIERLVWIYEKLPELPGEQLRSIELLKELSEGSKSAYFKLEEVLLTDNGELEKLLSYLREVDEKNNTNVYEEFKYTLLSVSPKFEAKIVNFESSIITEPTIKKAYISSLVWNNPVQNGSIIESKTDYGDNLIVDTSTEPPSRKMSLANSSYQLEADRWIWELYKPQLNYNKEVQRLTPLISSINVLSSQAIQGHIEDMVDENYDVSMIKSNLKTVYWVDVSYISTVEDLQIDKLETIRKQFEHDLIKAKEIYTQSLTKALIARKESIAEEDEKTREVLKFVHDIGFDLIDKKYTDQLIAEIKMGSLLIPGLDISPSRIDFKKGCFWEPEHEANTQKWKENLIKFFNKMISWNPGEPLNIEAHIWIGWKTENRVDMKYSLVQSWILSDMGTFNISIARENLKKEYNL